VSASYPKSDLAVFDQLLFIGEIVSGGRLAPLCRPEGLAAFPFFHCLGLVLPLCCRCVGRCVGYINFERAGDAQFDKVQGPRACVINF
jgi:hypothetical protein